MNERFKYPRTYHLPFSPGATADDKTLKSDEHLHGLEVIITEKMDGENITIYNDGFHARSLDSTHKEYHSWLINYIQNFMYKIPDGWRVCGEYLYAKHSIGYENLPSYFLVFSIWDKNECLCWDDTEIICEELGLCTVPVLWKTQYKTENIQQIATETVKSGGEGIVVRYSGSFQYDEFSSHIAKYVRKNHVQTDEHWSHMQIEKNLLMED